MFSNVSSVERQQKINEFKQTELQVKKTELHLNIIKSETEIENLKSGNYLSLKYKI